MIFFDALQCRSEVLESVYDNVLYMVRKVYAHSWPLVVRTSSSSMMMMMMMFGWLFAAGKEGGAPTSRPSCNDDLAGVSYRASKSFAIAYIPYLSLGRRRI